MTSLLVALSIVGASPAAGTSGFDFLRIDPTPREAALGGAAIGGAQSPLGFWYNPAHARLGGGQLAQVGYTNYAAGIHLGSLAYTQSVSDRFGVGLGVVYLNSGSMKHTNEYGEILGTFSSSYADLGLNGSLQLTENLAVGAGVHGLYGSIDTFFSVGVAGSAGATYALPLPGLQIGVAVRNLGLQARPFVENRDPLPLEIGAGAAWRPNEAVSLTLDVSKPSDGDVAVRAGVEGRIGEYLALRAGYNSAGDEWKTGGGADVLAGLTTGLGVRYLGYQLDYCFIPMVQLGAAHRISVSFSL
jgi:hypothetical protein